jgi:hypothetical protein
VGADFQNAFYAVFALPVAVMLAFLLAGTVTLSVLRLIVGAFSFWRPRRSSGDKF